LTRTPFDADALKRLRGRSITGRFFRTVSDRWRDEVDSPVGSSMVDGRYHTAAEDQALYLSDSPTLSMGESTRIFSTVPINERAWHTAAFEVDVKRVLDLTDPGVLERLGLAAADLLQPGPAGFAMPQAVATAARAKGFTAILAPTARPRLPGANLVVFLENVATSGGTVRVVK
jgi:RES domain-containing protein